MTHFNRLVLGWWKEGGRMGGWRWWWWRWWWWKWGAGGGSKALSHILCALLLSEHTVVSHTQTHAINTCKGSKLNLYTLSHCFSVHLPSHGCLWPDLRRDTEPGGESEREKEREGDLCWSQSAAPSLPSVAAAATVRVKGREGEAAEAELVFVSETRREEERAASCTEQSQSVFWYVSSVSASVQSLRTSARCLSSLAHQDSDTSHTNRWVSTASWWTCSSANMTWRYDYYVYLCRSLFATTMCWCSRHGLQKVMSKKWGVSIISCVWMWMWWMVCFFYLYVCMCVSVCEGLFTSWLTSEKDHWDLGKAVPLI